MNSAITGSYLSSCACPRETYCPGRTSCDSSCSQRAASVGLSGLHVAQLWFCCAETLAVCHEIETSVAVRKSVPKTKGEALRDVMTVLPGKTLTSEAYVVRIKENVVVNNNFATTDRRNVSPLGR